MPKLIPIDLPDITGPGPWTRALALGSIYAGWDHRIRSVVSLEPLQTQELQQGPPRLDTWNQTEWRACVDWEETARIRLLGRTYTTVETPTKLQGLPDAWQAQWISSQCGWIITGSAGATYWMEGHTGHRVITPLTRASRKERPENTFAATLGNRFFCTLCEQPHRAASPQDWAPCAHTLQRLVYGPAFPGHDPSRRAWSPAPRVATFTHRARWHISHHHCSETLYGVLAELLRFQETPCTTMLPPVTPACLACSHPYEAYTLETVSHRVLWQQCCQKWQQEEAALVASLDALFPLPHPCGPPRLTAIDHPPMTPPADVHGSEEQTPALCAPTTEAELHRVATALGPGTTRRWYRTPQHTWQLCLSCPLSIEDLIHRTGQASVVIGKDPQGRNQFSLIPDPIAAYLNQQFEGAAVPDHSRTTPEYSHYIPESLGLDPAFWARVSYQGTAGLLELHTQPIPNRTSK